MKKQILILISSTFFVLNAAHGMDSSNPENEGPNSIKKNTYALATGEKSSAREKAQDEFLWKTTLMLLKKGASKLGKTNDSLEGLTVCDAGCGNGTATARLVEEVGKTGFVHGIDSKKEQLEVAKRKVEMPWVKFTQADLQSKEGLPFEIVDIALARLLFMHVERPKAVIESLKHMLKDGGVVVCQEPAMTRSSHTPLFPSYEVFREYRETSLKLGEKLNLDYDVGNQLENYFTEAGFSTEVNYSPMVLNLTLTKVAFLGGLKEWGPRAIKEEVATSEKIEGLRKRIEDLPDDKDFSYNMVQAHVIAQKPRKSQN